MEEAEIMVNLLSARNVFKTANDDYRRNPIPGVSERGACSSQFIAGSNDNKSGGKTDIAAIFGTFYIDVGEKLTYAVSALEDVKREYPNHKIAISYDIACKLCVHLRKFGT
ncbi:hypothetical protein BC829DRAFT_443148 [Chytridium lagenaria]|nr:hypothetical protein BC829DRAFT_443148 [Chytridium lagenaria]